MLSVNDGDGNVVTLENSERIRNAIGFSSANFKIEYAADIDVVTSDGTVQNRRVTGILTADGFKKFTGFGDSYETVSGGTVAPDKIIVSGVGSGHGVGFSATGAEKLTREGYNYQYLLTFFFDGTQLKQLY